MAFMQKLLGFQNLVIEILKKSQMKVPLLPFEIMAMQRVRLSKQIGETL